MKLVKTDTEAAVIQKWFNEITDFIQSKSLSHIEVKLKEDEFTELDIFYDNNEHVYRIKFTDDLYRHQVNNLIQPKPIFRRELRPDELEALLQLVSRQ